MLPLPVPFLFGALIPFLRFLISYQFKEEIEATARVAGDIAQAVQSYFQQECSQKTN